MKCCSGCRQNKPLQDFIRNGREWKTCTPCRDYRLGKHHSMAIINGPINALRTKLGVNPDVFADMFTQQGGRCAICTSGLDLAGRSTHLDHDHETMSVRGILCRSCNTGLGLFKDDPVILAAALSYLEEHGKPLPN